MILNNFFWGVWALMLLQDSDITSEKVFNYTFAEGRAMLIKK